MVTVGFVALGCPKNIVDSEKMLAEIGESGFVLSGDPDNADVVVINTCGFIAPAKEEALDAIRRAVSLKKKGRVGKVVVCGCLSERMGEALLEEAAGIDAVVGLAHRGEIGRIIGEVMGGGSKDKGKGKTRARLYLGGDGGPQDDRGRLLITPGHWAYLRISEGCDRKCSFCTIPAIRGRFRSKDAEIVLAEARELVGSGAVELSLIAQDSNYYMRDRGVKNGLVKLIESLVAVEGLEWIRLMYLYPAGVDEELIAAMAAQEKVLNYVDMPVQHINDEILKRMRRTDRKEKTMQLIGARFDALGCFPFYAEEGTVAAALDGQVPEEVRRARADRLMLVQQEVAFAAARGRIGEELICLVDEADENGAVGRFYGQAPHIDSVCHIEECKAEPGEFVRCRVVDTQDYDLVAATNPDCGRSQER